MLGGLKAFAETAGAKKLYDLERLKYKGGLRKEVDPGFDESKIITPEQVAQLKRERPDLSAGIDFKGTPIEVMVCGGSDEQIAGEALGEGRKPAAGRESSKAEKAGSAKPATVESS